LPGISWSFHGTHDFWYDLHKIMNARSIGLEVWTGWKKVCEIYLELLLSLMVKSDIWNSFHCRNTILSLNIMGQSYHLGKVCSV
jgi:hypothetical protein